MVEEQDGKCTVTNEITVAGVFGQYTSLKTGISLTFPVSPENFENEASRYQDRITATIQAFQNRVLVAAGKEKVWHGQPAPVSSENKPAARKRVPRRR